MMLRETMVMIPRLHSSTVINRRSDVKHHYRYPLIFCMVPRGGDNAVESV